MQRVFLPLIIKPMENSFIIIGPDGLSCQCSSAARRHQEKNMMGFKQLMKTALPVVGAVALTIAFPANANDGETTYMKVCKMCHGTGMMDAPKFGDAAAWSSRIAQGMDTLYDHAINGFGKMKPKGGKKSLSDDEVKAAVAYMVEHSK